MSQLSPYSRGSWAAGPKQSPSPSPSQYGLQPKVEIGNATGAINGLLAGERDADQSLSASRSMNSVLGMNQLSNADSSMRQARGNAAAARTSNTNAESQRWGAMTPQGLAQRGAQMQGQYKPKTPWAGNPAYGSVQPPATEYGPNQSTPQVRDRIANRFDPTSWAIHSRTPGEINQQIGDRTQRHLEARRQLGATVSDPNNSRGGYQYSPVNGTGLMGLPTPDPAAQQAARQQEIVKFREQGLARDARVANDPTAQARFRAMNGPDAKFDAGQYQGQLAQGTAMYNTYSRAARMSGTQPMSFDNFLSQYQSGHLSPEAQGLLQQGRQINQQVSDSRRPRGQTLQAAQFMNQRWGVPMAMPTDPARAQQWQDSLAMQGNPYAAQSNLMNQQQMAMMAQTNANNMAQLQNTMAQQAGLNIRAGMQSQPGLTPEQRSQVITHWSQNDPEIKRKQAYYAHVEPYMRSGEWATADLARRNEIMAQARQRGDEAARAADATRGMMARSFSEVTGQYGLNPPAVATPPTRDPSQPTPSQGSPFWMGGKTLPPETAQPQPQPSPGSQYGIDPSKNVPSAPPPAPATNDDMFGAYSSLKQFNNGAEPTIEQVQRYLAERGKAIPQPGANSGETRPFWQFSNGSAQGQQGSPFDSQYRDWLKQNKQYLGGEPENDPHDQYAPGNFSGF